MKDNMKERNARVKRETKETRVVVELELDGKGATKIDTGIKFFDHILTAFATHGFFDLVVNAEGDLSHHIIEDTAITLGKAFKDAIAADRAKTVRYGLAAVPMDDSIARCAVDIGSISGEGRSYTVLELGLVRERVEDLSTEDIPHFLVSFASHANLTLHIYARGENEHHRIEAIFKALGIALDKATRVEERRIK
ncbi:MAG: imidazoleglycerol-phosphate dehydratase [Methanophagales archaeon]|nr:imidazoleglycerol-phosphate dehydratase [Methanophagales archaeon]MCW3138663.1 imidazoleglycerol-phosphate dehydratase [Methanophagales archaeon]MCW3139126.1 imidazoleglycerol-phosphate dehydratase [Methanophagales archaeon]MCW7069062.1 imidazoleglycerol-phosphate dehydratase [Methanophagales archaeon]MCW7073282.1 imidazoleglycerol-phosphate dehydratase [Methanophagales archaeon]